MDAGRRLLLASIHDVSPRFEREVDALVELLQAHVGHRIALLVVPNHWGSAPIDPRSSFARRLRAWSDNGFEIFLHGFYHRDQGGHANTSDQLRARLMTAGEGEFLGLSRAEAAERIARGKRLLEDIIAGPVAGFIAPAWLYGEGALAAIADADFALAEDHMKVWSPTTGQRLASGPVITWASRTRMRLASSLVAAPAVRRLPMRALRVGVHPPDIHHPKLVRSIDKTLRIAARRRTAAAYGDLLERSAA